MTDRVFVVGPDGTAHVGEWAAGESEAYDLLHADYVPEDRIVAMLVGWRRLGMDPLVEARHFLKLRHVVLPDFGVSG